MWNNELWQGVHNNYHHHLCRSGQYNHDWMALLLDLGSARDTSLWVFWGQMRPDELRQLILDVDVSCLCVPYFAKFFQCSGQCNDGCLLTSILTDCCWSNYCRLDKIIALLLYARWIFATSREVFIMNVNVLWVHFMVSVLAGITGCGGGYRRSPQDGRGENGSRWYAEVCAPRRRWATGGIPRYQRQPR